MESYDHELEHSSDIVAAPGPEQEALKAINSYISAFNRRDLRGMNAAFHFPHVRIASGSIHVLEEDRFNDDEFFTTFIDRTGWDYSLWDYRHAVQSKEDKVHFAVQFTRYTSEGAVIGHYPSLWIVALIDGKWGVQARSSFAP